MKGARLILAIGTLSGTAAASCFNASEIVDMAWSPFAAAPMLEQALIAGAADIGWTLEPASASTGAFEIIGRVITASERRLQVCLIIRPDGQLAYQLFSSLQNRENAGFEPLDGKPQ